jgi:hypothetical protein
LVFEIVIAGKISKIVDITKIPNVNHVTRPIPFLFAKKYAIGDINKGKKTDAIRIPDSEAI